MTKILATIEARMTSKRLPGKVLKKINNKYPIIELIYLRVMKSKLIDNICVSTTNKKTDNILVKYLKKKKYRLFQRRRKECFKKNYRYCKIIQSRNYHSTYRRQSFIRC